MFWGKLHTFHRKKAVVVFLACILALVLLCIRLAWLMLGEAQYYSTQAENLHERTAD